MSALEREVASSADRAGRAPLTPVPTPPPASSPPRSVEGKLIRRLLSYVGNPPIEFVLWTGERIATTANTVAQVHITDRATLFGLVKDPHIRFGDAYSEGRIVIEGDLVAFIETMYRAAPSQPKAARTIGSFLRLSHSSRRNTLDGSRENIHHHYDIGNDFYSLWLGDTMAYTCAYYPHPDATLDEAQIAKFDHVCRKLQLRAGETVVEAGFGWGGLALHMARKYGVKVRAFNISHEQVVYARERAQREGYGSQIEYVEDDYRNITRPLRRVRVRGHAGARGRGELPAARWCGEARARQQWARPHSLHRPQPAGAAASVDHQAHFPRCLSSVPRRIHADLRAVGFLRDWTWRTCACTTRRRSSIGWSCSTRTRRKCARMFDEKFERMWRLYLAGSIAGFTTGTLQLFQVVFAPKTNNSLPMTRAHLYAD